MNVATCRIADDFAPSFGAAEPSTPASGSAQRQPLRLGLISAELRCFPEQASIQVRVSPYEIVLVALLIGRAELTGDSSTDGERVLLTPTTAGLLGREGVSTLAGMAAAASILLRLPRDAFQVLTSRRRKQPTRFAVVDLVVPTPPKLVEALSDIAGALSRQSEDETVALGSRLEAALLDAFLGDTSWGRLMQTPRAVSRAVAAIHSGADLAPETLAVASGVTLRTLREGFAAAFGMPLAAYLQQVRLDKARQRLSSSYDSRSILQVANDSGFTTASAFSRAYMRAFGEAPTETRARAVRSAPPMPARSRASSV